MKKILLIILIFVMLFSLPALSKPKKQKCQKPIYFFENVTKAEFINELDNIIQGSKFEVVKFYPELGFISIKYKVKSEKEIVSLDVKQYGNDIYIFFDISKNGTDLEDKIYKYLKKKYPKSYMVKSDYFCRDFQKDVYSINTRKKTSMKESVYKHEVYVMDMKRYVGYKKSVYRWKKFKEKLFKKKEKV